jgi:hypothetical protein
MAFFGRGELTLLFVVVDFSSTSIPLTTLRISSISFSSASFNALAKVHAKQTKAEGGWLKSVVKIPQTGMDESGSESEHDFSDEDYCERKHFQEPNMSKTSKASPAAKVKKTPP